MEWVTIVALGVVEGLTEFLPVSSTGHLIVAARAMRFQRFRGSLEGTFEIFIQLGAILAVVGYYLRDLWAQALAVLGRSSQRADVNRARRLWLGVLIAFLPAVVVGLPLHHWIKAALFRPSVIGVTLILGGLAFLLVERRFRQRPAATTTQLLEVRPVQSLWVGLAQTLALIPGVSRSGASIIGGMLVGLDRRVATAFSFYLAIPTLGGATIVDLLQSLDQLQPGDLSRLFLGVAVSMLVAWLSIGWLLRYVSRGSFVPFAIYRLVMGALVLALALLGQLDR